MLYFLCFFLPPVAVLFCGKPFTAFLNCLLIPTIIGAPLHALLVVMEHKKKGFIRNCEAYNSGNYGVNHG